MEKFKSSEKSNSLDNLKESTKCAIIAVLGATGFGLIGRGLINLAENNIFGGVPYLLGATGLLVTGSVAWTCAKRALNVLKK